MEPLRHVTCGGRTRRQTPAMGRVAQMSLIIVLDHRAGRTLDTGDETSFRLFSLFVRSLSVFRKFVIW